MTISPVRHASSAPVVAGVAELLARLNDLTLDELRAEWRQLYRSAPPRLSQDLMRRAIAYQAMNYQNVALKDEEGNLLVHPSVKETWDLAIEKAPELLSLVESEFRSILGVESASAAADMGDQAEAR